MDLNINLNITHDSEKTEKVTGEKTPTDFEAVFGQWEKLIKRKISQWM